jgi:putative ABC transport system substrate-binding protein
VIEYRYAEGKPDRLLELAAELVSLKVDVIVALRRWSGRKNRTTQTIPIVFAQFQIRCDRLVDSLARPGGNVTGLSNLAPELSGKRLELIKEAVPKITRVAFLSSGPAIA